MRRIAACCLVVAMGGLGCGTGTLPSDEVKLPDALTCGQTSWSVVQQLGVGSSVPSNLLLRDGTFYLSVASMGIVALPMTGGEPVVLTTDVAGRLWLEGDSLYYGQSDDKLRRLPLAGGTPTLVVDGMTSFVAPDYGVPGDTALDASYYYWDLSPQVGPATYAVWRAPRAGGAAEKLADLPPRQPAYSWPELTLTSDTLILALDSQNVAYAVPLAGGSMRMLPTPPAPASGTSNMLGGSSTAGVLWVNERWGNGEPYPTTFMSLSDVGAPSATTARPFWTEKPPFMRPFPMTSWPDGAGGWLVTGTEWHADGRHTSVWAVNAAGARGTRLGCNPSAGDGSVWSTVTTPDAVYAVVSYDDFANGGNQWMLIRIARVPAAPFGA